VIAGIAPAAPKKEWCKMPRFVFTYRHPAGYAPSADGAPAWMAWFEGMGEHLVDLGQPAVARTRLGNCESGRTELGGYSIVQADDLEAAAAIAKGCPHLEHGGGVEVGELGEVPTPRPKGA
jgi:YCII-related domain